MRDENESFTGVAFDVWYDCDNREATFLISPTEPGQYNIKKADAVKVCAYDETNAELTELGWVRIYIESQESMAKVANSLRRIANDLEKMSSIGLL